MFYQKRKIAKKKICEEGSVGWRFHRLRTVGDLAADRVLARPTGADAPLSTELEISRKDPLLSLIEYPSRTLRICERRTRCYAS